jgi:hypothetical protein
MKRVRLAGMNNEILNSSRPPVDSTGGVFINEAEVLRRVPVSRRTWFSWRMAGKVPTVKVGRRSLYHWVSVEAALLRLQRGGVI